MRDGPVEAVEAVDVQGASVMEGTWPDGHTDVVVHAAEPLEARDAWYEWRMMEGVWAEVQKQ